MLVDFTRKVYGQTNGSDIQSEWNTRCSPATIADDPTTPYLDNGIEYRINKALDEIP
jgi:hypothetical protein